MMQNKRFGFTLVEILVVIAIISILSGVIYASFGDARADSRDKVRKTDMKQLSLALELYKSQFGVYPEAGCGATTGWVGPGPGSVYPGCAEYIVDLAPEFISELPVDPNQSNDPDSGYLYRVSAARDSYKVLVWRTVESNLITDYADPFARCPRSFGSSWCGAIPESTTYAIYSRGQEAN